MCRTIITHMRKPVHMAGYTLTKTAIGLNLFTDKVKHALTVHFTNKVNQVEINLTNKTIDIPYRLITLDWWQSIESGECIIRETQHV